VKPMLYVLTLFVASLFGPSSAKAETRGDMRLLLGLKSLDEDAWGPLSHQVQAGLQLAVAKTKWPVDISVQFAKGRDSESKLAPGAGFLLPFSLFSPDAYITVAESETEELALGARKSWRSHGVRPYLAGGPALVRGRLRVESTRSRDSSLGYWLQAGLLFGSADGWTFGLDARYSRAGIRLAGVDAEAGGPQAGLTFGFGW